MTMHETKQDESNQLAVIKVITEWMQNLPMVGRNGDGFTYKLIPTVENESTPDYQMWWNNLCVGVVEIKCRNKLYWDWVIDRNKLENLFKNYMSHGIPAMLAMAYMKDGKIEQLYFADMRALIARKDDWGVATPEMMATTNHGKDTRDEPLEGVTIPSDLFWRLI